MASGKAKYIAGLRDLVGGFTLMEQRRSQRLLDRLDQERHKLDLERFEEEKRQNRTSESQAQSELNIERSKNIRQRVADQRLADRLEAMGTPEARVLGQAARAGLLKSDEVLGFLQPKQPTEKRAETSIEFYQRDPEGYRKYQESGWRPYRETSGGGGGSTPDDLRAQTIGLAKRIAAEAPTADVEVVRPEPKLPGMPRSLLDTRVNVTPKERDYQSFIPEASRYTSASDMPFPKTAPAPDAYEAMSEEEWLTAVNGAVSDALNRPVTEEEIAQSPQMQLLIFADPIHRRRLFTDIPRMFVREPAP